MQTDFSNPLASDLERILDQTAELFEELRGGRLFITGGTGFFGAWLLESFAWANARLGLDASALVLTRDPETFRGRAPHLADNPAVRLHAGDIRTFRFPEGEFSHIIHAAATSALATFNREDPLVKFDTVVEGTKRALDFALRCKARKLLLTSSGAVYGRQPNGMTHVPEDYPGAPDPADINAVWGESKRAAEYLCTYYSDRHGLEAKIARCFSFLGPFLQLNVHYAAGNFIRDGLNGGPIQINGDGTPCRSYLYAADLAVWLWTILFRAESRRAYNVGSEACVSIGELAGAVARCFPEPMAVKTAKTPVPGRAPERYVPSTARARAELGLRETVGLEEGIRRTISHVMSHRRLY